MMAKTMQRGMETATMRRGAERQDDKEGRDNAEGGDDAEEGGNRGK